MASQSEVLFDETLRTRIVEIEYAGLDEHTIKRLYMEETGEPLNIDVEVYHSEDYVDEVDSNGFNGTIIHFYDEEQGINQVYTIPRGTEADIDTDWRQHDAVYDLLGVFAGVDDAQYQALETFHNEVAATINKKTNSSIQLEKKGLGHSLGGVLIMMLQLMLGDHDIVHTYNTAAPSVYKMALVDDKFRELIREEFNVDLDNPSDIYRLNSERLEDLAEAYYKENGSVIEHTIMEQDILEAILSMRGFFQVGERVHVLDSFPGQNVRSLAEIIEDFPEQLAQDLQIFLAENVAEAYNVDGFDGMLRELTGIEADLVDDIVAVLNNEGNYSLWDKVLLVKEGHAMLKEVIKKAPEMIKALESIREALPEVLEILVDHEYITKHEMQAVLDELDLMIEDIIVVQEVATHVVENLFLEIILMGAPVYEPSGISRFTKFYELIKERVEKMPGRISEVEDHLAAFLEVLGKSGEAHSITTVVREVSDTNRYFDTNGDLIVRMPAIAEDGSAMNISVNLSSAVRLYTYGSDFVEQKTVLLQELIGEYEESYVNDFKRRKNMLLEKIDEMVTNPTRYQHLVGNFPSSAYREYRVKRIQAYENISPLPRAGFSMAFENIFEYINKEVNEERKMLLDFQEAIKKVVEADSTIGQQIRS